MGIAVRVENLSKRYLINHRANINYNMRELISEKAKSFFSKRKNTNRKSVEEFWALRDINFEINTGDRIGIIGRNGAGKSTLLKILSRITEPTSGKISIKGRIASLLEVGTGFHPELTGRENIYLNGSILGMNRAEINRKFDEIVDFSGVEKFLDTPVKRYSSGMYVRLAFAVSAHLETEILILDEVLAVGDFEFQKKCLGKMKDVSAQGRTILFVSHNMAAIQNLCKKSILLSKGRMVIYGQTGEIINNYLSVKINDDKLLSDIIERKGNGILRFQKGSVRIPHSAIENAVASFSDIQFELQFDMQNTHKIITSKIDIGINNHFGERVAWLSSDTIGYKLNLLKKKIVFVVKALPLAPGSYNCNLYCEINNEVADWLIGVLQFSVVEKDYYKMGKSVPSNQGNILLDYSIQ